MVEEVATINIACQGRFFDVDDVQVLWCGRSWFHGGTDSYIQQLLPKHSLGVDGVEMLSCGYSLPSMAEQVITWSF